MNVLNPTSAQPPRHRIALSLLVAAITFLAFARLIACDFTTLDDPDTIANNPRLRPPTLANVAHYWTATGEDAPFGLYIPVTYATWSAVAAVAGINPHAFHAANVLLHTLSALLVFHLLLRLFNCGAPAVIGALLFALHPVQVEPVAWASGTKDVLCGCLSIAALLEYINFAACGLASVSASSPPDEQTLSRKRRGNIHFTIATICFILAMLAKPTAIVVPLLALTIDRLLLQRDWSQILRWLWAWFTLMIPCAIWTTRAQPAPWSTSLPVWTRPAIATDAIAFYLYKLALPLHLIVDYGRRPQAVLDHGWIYWTWLVPAAIALFLIIRRPRFITAGACLFVIPLLPVLGLAPFMYQYVSTVTDHYLYLSLLGPAVLLAWLVQRSPRVMPLALILLLLLGGRTIAQEQYWQDTPTLFEHTLAINPNSFLACDQLGFYHAELARKLRWSSPAAAREQFAQAVGYYQRGLTIHPQYVPSIYNLAIVYRQIGREDDARAMLRRIVQLQPSLPPGLRADPIGLADRLLIYNDPATAVDWLDQVLRNNPTNARAQQLRQIALARAATRPVTPPTP
ncbi:MAG TPA: tetratricopeptide repeat protein [Tepidisphaeraceae bacterium]|nr:tetratricopeptide repeat protein [Tepidisphaeraceae bacterium]